MLTLGCNAYAHHAAACLVNDGRVVAAAAEERFSRRKNDGRFPTAAIRFCLDHAGASPSDLDAAAFHWDPWLGFPRRAWSVVRAGLAAGRMVDAHAGTWFDILFAERTFDYFMKSIGSTSRVPFLRVRHHLSHAAGSFFQTPWEQAAILVIDGTGEIASTSLAVGAGSDIRFLRQVGYPHSLGCLFVALTQYLGFLPESDEYKLMSLASLGSDRYLTDFRDLVRLLPDGTFRLDLHLFDYPRGGRNPWVSPRFIERFGPLRRPGEPLEQRHADIARALQVRLEETALHLARGLHRATGLDRLCLSGGVALNGVMNGRLLADGPFGEIHVQPAANDAGCCIGAGLWHQLAVRGLPRPGGPEPLYLGPGYDDDRCRNALRAAGLKPRRLGRAALLRRVAGLLADGRVVGWFQGRMEMGPRALGNRSIIADPRRPEMKDRINAKVKHREPFRPFAPAVPEPVAGDWFEIDRPSPAMLFVVPVRPEVQDRIPAVVHVDGTARVQTVAAAENRLFHDLIEAFGRLTGVPVVLNTSFNVMGEPIVCTPEQAVGCFLSTGIDDLVLGSWLVSKQEGDGSG